MSRTFDISLRVPDSESVRAVLEIAEGLSAFDPQLTFITCGNQRRRCDASNEQGLRDALLECAFVAEKCDVHFLIDIGKQTLLVIEFWGQQFDRRRLRWTGNVKLYANEYDLSRDASGDALGHFPSLQLSRVASWADLMFVAAMSRLQVPGYDIYNPIARLHLEGERNSFLARALAFDSWESFRFAVIAECLQARRGSPFDDFRDIGSHVEQAIRTERGVPEVVDVLLLEQRGEREWGDWPKLLSRFEAASASDIETVTHSVAASGRSGHLARLGDRYLLFASDTSGTVMPFVEAVGTLLG